MLIAGTFDLSVDEENGHIFVYKMDSCISLRKSKKVLWLL